MAKKRTTVDKWKKKKWFTIIAPKIFDRKKLGETPAENSKVVVGRTVEIPLNELSEQPGLRHIKVKFQIFKVEGDKAYTKLIGHEVSSAHMNRIVRRRRSKIDAIIDVKTKDKVNVRVNVAAIATAKIERRKEKAVRKKIFEIVEKAAKQNNFDQFMQQLLFGVIGAEIVKSVKNISTMRRVEIVKTKLIKK
jgi:small subunit ribosomal protein S3Ae